VFILKLVKVLCFDALLQVLILKEFEGDIIRCNLVPHPSTALGVKRYPHPPVFCKKRRQVAENKGDECGKESQEKTRGGKQMKRHDLRGTGRTVGTGGQRTSLSAVLLRIKDEKYRIRYYLSSEKLKTVD
jgi:hypothetical protein